MVHVNRSGTTLGQFSEDDVRQGLRAGRFIGTDLGWREGMPAWQPLSQFAEFSADLAAAPPPSQTTPESGPPPAATATAPAPTAGPVAVVAAAQPVTPEGGLPWDRRAEKGFFAAFIETMVMVLTEPNKAFLLMKREGGFGEPIIFALLGGCAGAIVSMLFSLAFNSIGLFAGQDRGLTAMMGLGVFSLVFVFVIPFAILIGLFIISAICHVCLMIVGGARHTFETTFRVVCFTHGSVGPLNMIPGCGGFVALVWGIVLYIIGFSRAHQIDTGRSVLAVLLPLIVCCGGGIVLAILIPTLAHHVQ